MFQQMRSKGSLKKCIDHTIKRGGGGKEKDLSSELLKKIKVPTAIQLKRGPHNGTAIKKNTFFAASL